MTLRGLMLVPIFLCGAFGLQAMAADAPSPPASPAGFKVIEWEALVPEGWDPLKGLRGMQNLGTLEDSNPKVLEAMREMRRVWDNAPTNDKLDGAAIRLPGYVVPLEQVKGELKEFLLVPYFGACIHSPPPPANQIVHILLDKPVKGFRSMDTVWVSGTLSTFRQDLAMGASGYRMKAAVVDRYEPPASR